MRGLLHTRSRPGIAGLLMILILGLCVIIVLYPAVFIVAEAFNVGEPGVFPPEALGIDHFAAISEDLGIMGNTLFVAGVATVMAMAIGFALAWILTRTNAPGARKLERLMELPYYMTPLVGAMAWGVLAAPKTGLINQVWRFLGEPNDLFNAYSPMGIAWVMALFEGTVAFVMISATMKSMDPALEESSRVLGGGKIRTTLCVTLPLVAPGLLSAFVFVFAEMLGAFAAAFVLGIPGRFYVVTTAIWDATQTFPPDYGRAAALGLSLFAAMVIMLTIAKMITRRGSYATITGKAFSPRPMHVGSGRWALSLFAWMYIFVSVFLPLAALLLTSLQRFATAILTDSIFTLANYRNAIATGTLGQAFVNSLTLGLAVATLGVPIIGILTWVIYRTQLPGRTLVEYTLMFPQAVPRMIFGLGLLWAWINIPIPIYGTLWLLGIAYFTVFLPLGLRTIAGVVMQVDRSLEECAQVCGASWAHRMRTISLPLLRPGLVACWLLIFIASIRELGASVFLMGPQSKVISPAIINAWLSSSSELSAAMSMILTATVFTAVLLLFGIGRRLAKVQL
jgi:iron(III) transport system permease protein